MTATAILLAGSRPGGDPLAAAHDVPTKALVPLAGEPMVLRPLKALLASPSIGSIRVLTQNPKRVGAVLPADSRIIVARSESTIAATLIAVANDRDIQWPILVTTADHALLDTASVDELLRAAKDADIAIGVVTKNTLLKRLPDSKRTWLRFRGESITGANLFYLGSAGVLPAIGLWRSVEQDRKRGWRLVMLAGLATLLGALLGFRSLDQVMSTVGRRLGLKMMAVRLSNPLAGVDVDKPADHHLATEIIEGRG